MFRPFRALGFLVTPFLGRCPRLICHAPLGLKLTLGEVAAAVGDAERCVIYADRGGDASWKMATRATHADALHQAGHRDEAGARFRQAEQMQADNQATYPLLYSLSGFQYCDLLLAVAERAAWQAILVRGISFIAKPQASASAGVDVHDKTDACGLPLHDGESPHSQICRAVSERAAQTLQWATGKLGLLDEALDHPTLGRAALYTAILKQSAM